MQTRSTSLFAVMAFALMTAIPCGAQHTQPSKAHSHGANVSGVVVDASGAPMADISVGLFMVTEAQAMYAEYNGGLSTSPARDVDVSRYPFLTRQDDQAFHAPVVGPMERELLVTKTDAAGRFHLSAPIEGTYTVRAYRSSLLEASIEGVVVPRPPNMTDLRLVLPPMEWIEGKILVPAGRSGAGMTVAAERAEPGSRPAVPLISSVADDGSFRLGPCAPGSYDVYVLATEYWRPVMLPNDPFPNHETLPPLRLGTVQLHSGGTARANFDMGARFPGSVRVHVMLAGAPVANSRVEIRDRDDRILALNFAETDESGVAWFPAVDTSATTVSLPYSPWKAAAMPVSVRSAETTEAWIELNGERR